MSTSNESRMDLDALSTQLLHELNRGKLSSELCQKIEQLDKTHLNNVIERQAHGRPLFLHAVKSGRVENVRFLVERCGVDVNKKWAWTRHGGIDFLTPLMFALHLSDSSMAKYLLENGARFLTEAMRSTPVFVACRFGHLDVVRWMIEHGANVSNKYDYDNTCLMISTTNPAMCKLLLSNGAEVDTTDNYGNTALHLAVIHLESETVKVLIEHGADATAQNYKGEDALQLACFHSKDNVTVMHIFDSLITAAQWPPARKVEALEIMGSRCISGLHDLASGLQYWKSALAIREANVGDVPEKNRPNNPEAALPWTRYFKAIEFNNVEELDELGYNRLALKIQSMVLCERILGPFHEATGQRLKSLIAYHVLSRNYQSCIDLFLRKIQLSAEKEESIVIAVCFILELVESGRAPLKSIKFNDIHMLIHVLAAQQRRAFGTENCLQYLVVLLYIMQGIPKTEFQNRRMVRQLKRIIVMTTSDLSKDTLLHAAVSRFSICSSGYFDQYVSIFPCASVARLLLDYGHGVDLFNIRKETPLHVAARFKNTEVAQLLLDYGAHVDLEDAERVEARSLLLEVPNLNFRPLQHLTLQCLASRIAAHHQVPSRDVLPNSLKQLLNLYCK